MLIAVGGVWGYSFSLQSLAPALIGVFIIILGITNLLYNLSKTKENENEETLDKRICPICMIALEKDIEVCPNCGKKI